MGKRGPKPTPTRLKKLAGITRADRLNEHEPEPPSGLPEAPTHLDKLALEEWHRIVPLLDEMGVLTRIDGAALSVYCDAHSRWLRARAELVKHGMLVKTKAGFKLNPAVSVINASLRTMQRCLAEFGCTPSSRSTLHVGGKGKDKAAGESPWAKAIKLSG
jgi:P27 family predicted phage terminase small subunit